jgi:hypothetical protein
MGSNDKLSCRAETDGTALSANEINPISIGLYADNSSAMLGSFRCTVFDTIKLALLGNTLFKFQRIVLEFPNIIFSSNWINYPSIFRKNSSYDPYNSKPQSISVR